MTDCRDIFRVSIPLCCGTIASAIILATTHSYGSGYALAAISAPIAYSAATIIYRNGSLRSNSIAWIFLLFTAGILCHSTKTVTSPGICEGQYFQGMHIRLEKAIENIPFRNSENNALAKALILGDRTSLSRATKENFRNAGAAHLLALSGMHLGIIYLMVNSCLMIFGNSIPARKARNILTITITAFYTVLCGAGPSIVRAWLFILLNESSKLLERPQPPGQIFCAALTIHLIFKPESIGELGFQLSYLAMMGIVFVWPRMRKWYKDDDSPGTVGSIIWDAASLSICCQLFTAPVTLLHFGTFPKYFLITNLVSAPLMTVVMCSGLAALTLSALTGGCHPLLTEVCEMPLTVLREFLETIALM